MRIHHLNCCTLCPLGGKLMDGVSPGIGEAKLVCHCLLIEGPDGLILVDTGLGMRDVQAPTPRLSAFFLNVLRPRLRGEETAVERIRELGFAPGEVRHILLTHLDFDHAGGLDDFPDAQVHVMASEIHAARERKNFIARGRYRPMQLTRSQEWHAYIPSGEDWFGFEAVHGLEGLPPEILLIPLAGHTLGHAGVAVNTDRGWLLHCGDAYFFRGEMDAGHPHCTPGLKAYQRMMDTDRRMRLNNQERLRELVQSHSGEVSVFSAHDAIEFAQASREIRSLREEDMETGWHGRFDSDDPIHAV